MDETHLWALIEDQGERRPLLTGGEARAVVQLLQILAAYNGEEAGAADALAATLALRLPATEA